MGASEQANPNVDLALVIVSDVDACLIDGHTYSAGTAGDAVAQLNRCGVPLVLCSSKTRAELEALREHLGIGHPFISENGAALHLPEGYFPFDIPGALRIAGADVVVFGRPYAQVVAALRHAAEAVGIRIEGFCDMSVEQVAAACGLSLEAAHLAKRREYDEPFRVIEPNPAARSRLSQALHDGGVRVLAGGRFDHAIGDSDKGRATAVLRGLYRKAFGPTTTVGLGDAMNDVALLRSVDIPIVVRSASGGVTAEVHRAVPWARVTSAEGPAGWREAVLSILDERMRVWRGDTRATRPSTPGGAAGLSQPSGSVG